MKRKQYSPELKKQIVKEVLETGNASIVARRHDISASLVNRWVKSYKEYGENVFRSGNGLHKSKQLPITYNIEEFKKLSSENDILKKILGEKDLEVEILRDLLKKKRTHT